MRKAALKIFSIAITVVIILSVLPANTFQNTVLAYPKYKTEYNTCLCTSGIASPKKGNGGWSYLLLGKDKENSDGYFTPMRFRVLAPRTTEYGSRTMLLESSNTLSYSDYLIGPNSKPTDVTNVWGESSIRYSLNNNFLSDFEPRERTAIAQSIIKGGEKYPSGSIRISFRENCRY